MDQGGRERPLTSGGEGARGPERAVPSSEGTRAGTSDPEGGYPPPPPRGESGYPPPRGREGVESGYSTQSREKKEEVPFIDTDNQVWHPQELFSSQLQSLKFAFSPSILLL